MAKKSSGRHPIFGYLKDIIFGFICLAIILFLVSFGFIDRKNEPNKQGQQFTNHAKNSLVAFYNRNNKPLQKYVKQRTDGDLKKESPNVKQIGQLPKASFNMHINTPNGFSRQAKITNVSLDDTGNGTFMLKGHKYLFQLADIQFAPHNSKFYKKNHTAIQADIQNEVSKGNFTISKDSHNQIDLYKNGKLVSNQFLSKGIVYMPNINTHKGMLATEKMAKAKKVGFWSIPDIVGGDSSMQVYSISAENGHRIPTAGISNQQHGGQSMTQSIKSWFSRH